MPWTVLLLSRFWFRWKILLSAGVWPMHTCGHHTMRDIQIECWNFLVFTVLCTSEYCLVINAVLWTYLLILTVNRTHTWALCVCVYVGGSISTINPWQTCLICICIIWETVWSWNSCLIEGTAFMALFIVSLCIILCAAAATLPGQAVSSTNTPPTTSTNFRKELGEGLSPKKESSGTKCFSQKKYWSPCDLNIFYLKNLVPQLSLWQTVRSRLCWVEHKWYAWSYYLNDRG